MGPTEVGGKVERISLPPSSIRILPLACESEYLIKYCLDIEDICRWVQVVGVHSISYLR